MCSEVSRQVGQFVLAPLAVFFWPCVKHTVVMDHFTPSSIAFKANLREVVMFGCSRGDLLDNVLGLMNHEYVPVSMANGWPDNVKKDFTSQVQRFMSTMTEMAHQDKGSVV